MTNDPHKDPKLIQQLPYSSKVRATQAIYECGYCHKQFVARTSEIYSGKVRSCGCLRRSRRAEHTSRTLNAWGSSKTKWVGQRFLAHMRLAASARAAADKQLMKSLGIKDKDILFKAAQIAQQPTSDLPRQEVAVEPEASRAASNTPLVELPTSTIINIQGDLIMSKDIVSYRPATAPTREIPYEQTEEGYTALEIYWGQHKKPPADDFDLKGWYTQQASRHTVN